MTLTIRDPDLFLSSLSAMMLTEPKPSYIYDQFASKEIEFGKGKGDTVQINRYPYFGDNGLTESSRSLDEQQTIGTSDPINQEVNKISVLLKEYSGPYNAVADSVAPLGVTEKVARQAQAKLIDSGNPADFFNSIGGRSLKDDHDRWHDRVLCNLMLTTTNVRNPDGVADGSTALTSTGSKLDHEDLMAIKEQMLSANVPTFEDGLYYATVSPRMEKHLRQDTDFREAMNYYNPTLRMRGELGIYEGFRFFVSTNIPTATVNSLTAYQGLFFGANAVGYGEGDLPVQVRMNKNDDYERFMYLIWLVYRGYALLDGRFIFKATTFAV